MELLENVSSIAQASGLAKHSCLITNKNGFTVMDLPHGMLLLVLL